VKKKGKSGENGGKSKKIPILRERFYTKRGNYYSLFRENV